MTFVPGYKYDIFVSYAPVDNQPLPGAEKGWVSYFIKALKVYLDQKLGRKDAYELWMDTRLAGNVRISDEMLDILTHTATLVIVLSRGYLESEWCQRQKNAFLKMVKERTRADSRVFVVEIDRLEAEQIPREFRELQGYPFLENREGRSPRRLGTPTPQPTEQKYYDLLSDLSYDLEGELQRLKASPETEQSIISGKQYFTEQHIQASRQTTKADTDAPGTVFLAEVSTYDLEALRDQIRRSLTQWNIRVLPEREYPRTPGQFQKAVSHDLQQSDLFVQLLSAQPEKTFPDLPQGCGRCQYDIALETDTQILQWRSPEIDPDAVRDPGQRLLLQGTDVVVMRTEELKTEILNRLRPQNPPMLLAEVPNNYRCWMFVNAHPEDEGLKTELCQRLGDTFRVSCFERLGSEDPAVNREYFKQLVLECPGLMIVYGESNAAWVSTQVREVFKLASQRPPETPLTLFGIYDGPPEQKRQLPFTVPNIQVLWCRNCVDEKKLGEFVRPLLTGAV
ncbi:MAG: toll/interleukin-1 receptor domain-containing protein [bacterium]|nr:toll/interleukin-1 receptor domain-containing protein [bacterium]